MTRTQIYLPDDVHELVKMTALGRRIPMAAFIRECINFRCRHLQGEKSVPANKTARGLLSLSGLVKKGPTDMGKNHDYYLYGFPKK